MSNPFDIKYCVGSDLKPINYVRFTDSPTFVKLILLLLYPS